MWRSWRSSPHAWNSKNRCTSRQVADHTTSAPGEWFHSAPQSPNGKRNQIPPEMIQRLEEKLERALMVSLSQGWVALCSSHHEVLPSCRLLQQTVGKT